MEFLVQTYIYSGISAFVHLVLLMGSVMAVDSHSIVGNLSFPNF